MKDSNFNSIIREELMNEVAEIEMSEELKNRIRENTIKKHDTLIQKIKKTLDRNIEIPVASAIAGCMIMVIVFCFPILNNSIKAYSMENKKNIYEVVDVGSFQIVFDSKKEVMGIENHKN